MPRRSFASIKKTAIRLAREGELPGLRVGKHWRFRLSDLAIWTESRVRCVPANRVTEKDMPVTRYQEGSIERVKRAKGPDLWAFRYRQGVDGL